MGLFQSTPVDNRDRKTIEYEVFDNSFQLIEKYVKVNTRGLCQRFRREYDSATKRVLDWSRVFDRALRNGRQNMGYIEAIKVTAKLLRDARQSADRSDRRAIDQIYRSVDRLVQLRKEELDPKLAIFCIVLWGGDAYNSHKVVVDAWTHFKRG